MNSRLNDSNKDQNLEHPPHFKNVFQSSDVASNVSSVAGTNSVIVSESRRPSLVFPPNLKNVNVVNVNVNVNSNITVSVVKKHHNHIKSEINDGINDGNISTINFNNNSGSGSGGNHSHPHAHAHAHAHSSKANAKKLLKSNKITKNTYPQMKKCRSRSLPNIRFPSYKRSQCLMSDLQKNNSNSTLDNNSSNQRPLPVPYSSYPYPKSKNITQLQSYSQTQVPLQGGTTQIAVQAQAQAQQKQFQIQQQQLQQHQHQHQHQQHQQQSLLPPVNLQSMREIDLQEVLKNPQLRHDILFDTQLQFRPNLDGERGKRKKFQADNYWLMIKNEIKQILNSDIKISENCPISIMFKSLKNILLSLIPAKDKFLIEEILDLNLIIQQLNSKSFNFVKFADWICSIFKMHCAPMRDVWVDELNLIFHNACKSKINIGLLIEGLRILFSILEAMKLDVANHQIRILRPSLCSTAVSFEKEYFNNAIRNKKINFNLSLLWFKKNSIKLNSVNARKILNYSILNLLSCSNMCNEFPNILTFDHTRLIILRADIRHLICTKIISILHQNLIQKYNVSNEKNSLTSNSKLFELKNEILNIIIDENGNSKWTKNLKNISIHLVNKLFKNLDNEKIQFSFNWSLKQTQPNSKVYSILESKIFEKILTNLDNQTDEKSFLNDDLIINDELKNITSRLNQLIEFNYDVFGEFYNSYLK